MGSVRFRQVPRWPVLPVAPLSMVAWGVRVLTHQISHFSCFSISPLSFPPFLLPSPIPNVSAVSKCLVLVGGRNIGVRGEVGKIDRRCTWRGPTEHQQGELRPQIHLFFRGFCAFDPPRVLLSSSHPQYPKFRLFRNACYWLLGGILGRAEGKVG